MRSNITTCYSTDLAAMAGTRRFECLCRCRIGPTCARYERYLQLSARHDAIVANFSATQPVTVANARIFAASGITGSVKFAQCKRFAQQYIVPLDYVVTNGARNFTPPSATHQCVCTDTECYAEPGTDEFAADPCCNVAASWSGACLPRRAVRSVYAANDLVRTRIRLSADFHAHSTF